MPPLSDVVGVEIVLPEGPPSLAEIAEHLRELSRTSRDAAAYVSSPIAAAELTHRARWYADAAATVAACAGRLERER